MEAGIHIFRRRKLLDNIFVMPEENFDFDNESVSILQDEPNMTEDPAERNICDSCQ